MTGTSIKSMGDRIKQRLDATGQTAREASLKSGGSASYIRNITRGSVSGDHHGKLAKLAVVLKCDVSWLLTGVDRRGTSRADDQDKMAEALVLLAPLMLALPSGRCTLAWPSGPDVVYTAEQIATIHAAVRLALNPGGAA